MNEYSLIALLGILAAMGIALLCYWLIRSERPPCHEDERLNKTLPAQPRYDVPVLEADSDTEAAREAMIASQPVLAENWDSEEDAAVWDEETKPPCECRAVLQAIQFIEEMEG